MPMSPQEFAALKASVRTTLTDAIAKERERLGMERDFLQSVLDSSIGQPGQAYKQVALDAALADLAVFLG